MNKQVYDYFVDFHKMDVPKVQNTIQFNIDSERLATPLLCRLPKYKFHNTPIFLKYWKGNTSIFSIASSDMSNSVGLITPPLHLVVADDYDRECDDDNEEECLYTLSQDVQSAKSLESISAHMCNEYKSILEEHCNHFYKWDILYNKTLHAYLLQIMTQDCLDDIINLFLLDEIRTDVDRHYGNYFLYKSPNSQKFEGIMPIDMEEGEICYYSAKDFDKFVNGQYRSFLLSERIDYLSYADRLKQLRQEITKGNLPSKQIKFLRDCLNYDLPKKIKDICTSHKFNCLRNNTTLYDTVSELWDYNHAELDDSLGL